MRWFVAVGVAASTVPVTSILPTTSSFSDGVIVPIPTLPKPFTVRALPEATSTARAQAVDTLDVCDELSISTV